MDTGKELRETGNDFEMISSEVAQGECAMEQNRAFKMKFTSVQKSRARIIHHTNSTEATFKLQPSFCADPLHRGEFHP